MVLKLVHLFHDELRVMVFSWCSLFHEDTVRHALALSQPGGDLQRALWLPGYFTCTALKSYFPLQSTCVKF
jgi:hypothetical protein